MSALLDSENCVIPPAILRCLELVHDYKAGRVDADKLGRWHKERLAPEQFQELWGLVAADEQRKHYWDDVVGWVPCFLTLHHSVITSYTVQLR